MFKLVKKQPVKPISLREHHERRNKVLIKRRCGGFGDVLMQRMMFEDMRFGFPGIDLNYACPHAYVDMATNHPFVNTIELEKVKEREFGVIYDISTACRVHECKHGDKNQDHRSDIWAKYCGVELTHHNMHLTADAAMLKNCQEVLAHRNPAAKPIVLLATQSTNDEFGQAKSLMPHQITGVVQGLLEQGYFPITVHHERQTIYDNLGVEQFTSLHPLAWIALVSAVDYVISVDTGTFHMAGGVGKPLVGIFTFTDGKVYGKYYDFILVQRHRDNGDWDCGPCFNLGTCPKEQASCLKPCLTSITAAEILAGFAEATKKWPAQRSAEKTA